MSNDQFIFRSNHTIGAAAAEQDEQYLRDCFVDTGILDVLLDDSDHRCLLVGRTGAGKSALISRIRERCEYVISINPEDLSLEYISNSNVINFFTEVGINMTPFYRLLWRHIFVVEVLKVRFGIDSENRKIKAFESILNLIPGREKNKAALEYLEEWGNTFWQETDYRVKEVTRKFEDDLKDAAKFAFPNIGSIDATSARKLTQEQKEEVINRAQEVVSKVQIKKLNEIIEFLGELLLPDKQKKYYIIIDKLDEDWVENSLRFRIIRELVETALRFNRISNVKVIIAIRNDLLHRVYRLTRDSGFQEEKYLSSSIDLVWSAEDLTQVLDLRINKLVKSQYTRQKVNHGDLLRTIHLPQRNPVEAIDYMIERTLLRPRDLIAFFNECIILSNGKPMVDANNLLTAEGSYSGGRFHALLDEWSGVYPSLEIYAQILKKRKPNFRVEDISIEDIEDCCLKVASSLTSDEANVSIEMGVINGRMNASEYRKHLITILYKVSLLGVRISDSMPSVAWSYLAGSSISEAEIEDTSRLYIQKTFWRHLGVVA
jgi:hypothetical protein